MSFNPNYTTPVAYENPIPTLEPQAHELDPTTPPLSAHELAAGIAGDRNLQRVIGGVARRFSADPEDLGQDLCERVLKTEGRLPSDLDSAGVWVGTVARNLATNDLRHKSRRPQISARVFDETAFGQTDPGIADADDQHLLAFLLQGLSAKRRRILALHYLEGYTQMEIAEMLDIPLGTVKSEAWRGLRAAREAATKVRRD